MLLETKNLRIRQLTEDDTELIFAYSREESMKKWIPDQVYEDMDEAKEVVAFLMSMYNSEELAYPQVMAIELKDTGLLIGHVGLSEIDEGIEIGYAIAEAYQRNGYAREALTAFIPYAKLNYTLPTIHGIVKSRNIASYKTLERVGFTFLKEEDRNSHGSIYKRKVYTI